LLQIGCLARYALMGFLVAVLARDGDASAWADDASARMTGVNLSGGELNPGANKPDVDYTYPSAQEIDYFVSKGLTIFRIPVLSERLLGPSGRGERPLTRDWIALSNLIDHASHLHARVIVDFHEYGANSSGIIGLNARATQDFAQSWGEVAKRLKEHPNVVFGLMNEPHQQSASEWLIGANAAIAAIRSAGARQLILVPGAYWTGAHSWTKTDNGKVMARVVDPADNFAYEVHQYLDSDSSGTKPEVVAGSGATRLADFTTWAHAHHVKGFLGEFGFASTPDALGEGRALVRYMTANRDVWLGWTYWAGGPWWGDDYMFSVEPTKTGDRPQLGVLTDEK
jgi:endoglucanase